MWQATGRIIRKIFSSVWVALTALVLLIEAFQYTLQPFFFPENNISVATLHLEEKIRIFKEDISTDIDQRFARNTAQLDELLTLVRNGEQRKINFSLRKISQPAERLFSTAQGGQTFRPTETTYAQSEIRRRASALSRRTGVFGGRKVDFQTACLPSAEFNRVEIIELDNTRRESGRYAFADAPNKKKAMTMGDYALLNSQRDADKDAIISRFKAGCYALELTQAGTKRQCVLALAISGIRFGASSVGTANCMIEGQAPGVL